jgi:hypothetical protein
LAGRIIEGDDVQLRQSARTAANKLVVFTQYAVRKRRRRRRKNPSSISTPAGKMCAESINAFHGVRKINSRRRMER